MNRPDRFDRAHVTQASRRTLPTYPLFCVIVGMVWALDPGHRLGDNAGLSFAGRWTPLMGVVVLTIGAWLVATLALGELDPSARFDYRLGYTRGLGALVFWMVVWALVMFGAACFGHATFAAWVWPAAFARFCWASMVSLQSREV